MLKYLRVNPAKRFAKDQYGMLSIELAILLPVMFLWFAGTFVFFNAFHKWLKSVKANYTVADLISRQQHKEVAFFYALDPIFDEISQTEDDANSYFTVTLVEWDYTDPDNPDLVIYCSESTKTAPLTQTNIQVADIESRIPALIPEGDRVALVTSYSPYTPIFDWVGIPATTFKNDMVTPFRFTGKLEISECAPPAPPADAPEDYGDPDDNGSGGEPEDAGSN